MTELGLFSDRVESDLWSLDTRTELIGLEKFGPNSYPIDDRVGSDLIEFGRFEVGLRSDWMKMVDFSVIFCWIGRLGWTIEWPDTRTEYGRVS